MARFPLNESVESALVDQFIDALWNDPNANAPADLDPAFAEFIRAVARAEQVTTTRSMQSRVWQKALLTARAAEYRQPKDQDAPFTVSASPQSLEPSGVKPMLAVYPKAKRNERRTPERGALTTFAFLAATAVFAILISTSAFFNQPVTPQAGNVVVVSIAATETPTPIPTATPIAMQIDAPTATPFPVTLVPLTGGTVINLTAVPCDININLGNPSVGGPISALPTLIPPSVGAVVPNCIFETTNSPFQVITLDLKTLKPEKFTSTTETSGEINAQKLYTYYIYESDKDQKWDITVTGIAAEAKASPDFSLVVFDELESVAYGVVTVIPVYQMGIPVTKTLMNQVYFDADGGAGRDPELLGVEFKKGHRYGIYIMQGKPDQFGKFTVKLKPSAE
jgi:hypothetical protein